MSDIVKLYNPANASSLTQDQVLALQQLTSGEIKELARAYPNAVMQRAYLLIVDSSKPASKQLPALSSFENLYNLREKNGQKTFVAFAFRGNYKPATIRQQAQRSKKVEVIDLSDVELLKLPGFKTSSEAVPEQEVKVVKVKKSAKKVTDDETKDITV